MKGTPKTAREEVKSQKVVDMQQAPPAGSVPAVGGVDKESRATAHQEKLDELGRVYREELAVLAPKALSVFSAQMDDPLLTPGQKASRAREILDRFREIVELDLKVLLTRAKIGVLEGNSGSSYNPAGRVDWTKVPREKMVEICRKKIPEARKLIS